MERYKDPAWWIVIGFIAIVIGISAIQARPEEESFIKFTDPVEVQKAKVPKGRILAVEAIPKDAQPAHDVTVTGSTGTINIHVDAVHPGAIMVNSFSNGRLICLPSKQILDFQDAGSYRVINTSHGTVYNVAETFQQIRIKLQNTGWLVY